MTSSATPSRPDRPDPTQITTRDQLVAALKILKGDLSYSILATMSGDLRPSDVPDVPEIPRWRPEQLLRGTVSGWFGSGRELPTPPKLLTFLMVTDVPPSEWSAWLTAVDRVRSKRTAQHGGGRGPGLDGDQDEAQSQTNDARCGSGDSKGWRPTQRWLIGVGIVLLIAVVVLVGYGVFVAASDTGAQAASPPSVLKCPETAPASFTLVVGARANSPEPKLPAVLLERLTGAARAGQRITVIRLDGDPQPVFDETPQFAAQNGSALEASVGDLVKALNAVLAGPARAAVPEADVLSALSLASRTTQPRGTIVVLDSGLQTTAPLDFRASGLLVADPVETVGYLRKQDLVPDLGGRSLVFVGLGETAKPQDGLNDHLRRNLSAIWQAIGEAGGACVDRLATGSAEISVTGVPTVSPVILPKLAGLPTPCGTTDLTALNNVGFLPDTAVFEDNTAARAAIATIVNQARAGAQKIEIVGMTPRTGSREVQVYLSLRRAETVRDVMVGLGISPDRITASGAGSYSALYVPDGGPDNLDPGLAAQNRRVTVSLLCT